MRFANILFITVHIYLLYCLSLTAEKNKRTMEFVDFDKIEDFPIIAVDDSLKIK